MKLRMSDDIMIFPYIYIYSLHTHTHIYIFIYIYIHICRKGGVCRIGLVIPVTPVSAIMVMQSCKKHVN